MSNVRYKNSMYALATFRDVSSSSELNKSKNDLLCRISVVIAEITSKMFWPSGMCKW
jgi:hypothetical protein